MKKQPYFMPIEKGVVRFWYVQRSDGIEVTVRELNLHFEETEKFGNAKCANKYRKYDRKDPRLKNCKAGQGMWIKDLSIDFNTLRFAKIIKDRICKTCGHRYRR